MNINTLDNVMDGAYIVTKNNQTKTKIFNYLNKDNREKFILQVLIEFNNMEDKPLTHAQMNKINKN